MPRCLMAKKWKAYPWQVRTEGATVDTAADEEEEIDVVGDTPSSIAAAAAAAPTCWGPSSPTAGTTAPSPPPHTPEEATRGSTIYNGEYLNKFFFFFFSILWGKVRGRVRGGSGAQTILFILYLYCIPKYKWPFGHTFESIFTNYLIGFVPLPTTTSPPHLPHLRHTPKIGYIGITQ